MTMMMMMIKAMDVVYAVRGKGTVGSWYCTTFLRIARYILGAFHV
jgi:hypothetical protein